MLVAASRLTVRCGKRDKKWLVYLGLGGRWPIRSAITTAKVGMKVGPSTRKALFVLGRGKNRVPSTRKAISVLGRKKYRVPSTRRVVFVLGRGGNSFRRPKADRACRPARRLLTASPSPRGEGFGVGVTWAPVGAVQKKTPKSDRTQGSSKNRGYLLSHLVGQYHRRW